MNGKGIVLALALALALGLGLAQGCVRDRPAPPLPEVSPLAALPDSVEVVAWGEARALAWADDFPWLQTAPDLIRGVGRELNALGVPRDRLRHLVVAIHTRTSGFQWLFLLDGDWKARDVVRGKREMHGEASHLDIGGELGVRMREGVLLGAAGAHRIAVGSEDLVRETLATVQAGGGKMEAHLQALVSTLPEGPLHVASLTPRFHLPGVVEGAIAVRNVPNLWVEGQLTCNGVEGCQRFQEALHQYATSAIAAAAPPPPEALRFLQGLRFSPDGAQGRLVLDPIDL